MFQAEEVGTPLRLVPEGQRGGLRHPTNFIERRNMGPAILGEALMTKPITPVLQHTQECRQVRLFTLCESHAKPYIVECDHVLEARG